MKTVSLRNFQANCLALIDEVKAKRESVVITSGGIAVAKLVPAKTEDDDIFGFYKGKGRLRGDAISPAFSLIK